MMGRPEDKQELSRSSTKPGSTPRFQWRLRTTVVGRRNKGTVYGPFAMPNGDPPSLTLWGDEK